MKHKPICGAVLIAAIAMLAPQATSASDKTTAGGKVGVLTCKTVKGSGVNLMIHSTQNIKCAFRSTTGAGVEYYKGETGVGLGIDINIKRKETLTYGVFSADFVPGSYQLAGKYGGAGASATVGVGIGAQALVGGNNKSVSLEPVISGSTGGGVSAGITYLYLEPDKRRDMNKGKMEDD